METEDIRAINEDVTGLKQRVDVLEKQAFTFGKA
jgi:hypothetical protein